MKRQCIITVCVALIISAATSANGNAQSQIVVAKRLVSEGRGDSAIAMLSKMIKDCPTNKDLLFARADIYKQMGDSASAMYDYTILTHAYPGNVDALVAAAKYYRGIQHGWDAYKVLSRAIDIAPNDTSLRIMRADIINTDLERGDYDSIATRDVDFVLKIDSLNRRALKIRMGLSWYYGQWRTALTTANRMLVNKPDEWFMHVTLGKTWNNLDEHDKAISEFKTAPGLVIADTAADMQKVKILNELAISYADMGLLDTALAILHSVEAISPDDPDAMYLTARVLLNKKDYASALQLFDRYMMTRPETREAHYYRGLAFQSLGRMDSAIACYKRCISQTKRLLLPYRQLVWILIDSEDYAGAREILIKAIEDWTPLFGLYTLMSDVAYSQGNVGEAIYWLDQCMLRDSDSTYVSAWERRGELMRELGLVDRAMEDFNTAIYLNPDYAYAWKQRAYLHWSMDENEKACSDVRMAASLGDEESADMVNRYCMGED